MHLDCGYRLDLLVEERLPLELKAVPQLHAIDDAQLMTYLRIGKFPLGLLINFNVAVLKEGIRLRVASREWQIPPIEYAAIRRIDRSTNDGQIGWNSHGCDVVVKAATIRRHFGSRAGCFVEEGSMRILWTLLKVIVGLAIFFALPVAPLALATSAILA